MISKKILKRVFNIRVKDSTGACFAIEYENKQYLITVKHLFEGIKYPNESIISILRNINMRKGYRCMIHPYHRSMTTSI